MDRKRPLRAQERPGGEPTAEGEARRDPPPRLGNIRALPKVSLSLCFQSYSGRGTDIKTRYQTKGHSETESDLLEKKPSVRVKTGLRAGRESMRGEAKTRQSVGAGWPPLHRGVLVSPWGNMEKLLSRRPPGGDGTDGNRPTESTSCVTAWEMPRIKAGF